MSRWVLLKNGNILDGLGNPPTDPASVLIEDNRIAAIGPEVGIETVPRGEDIQVIDASGKTIMPGLIDAHCHLTYGESRTQEEQDLYTSVEGRTLRAAWNAKKILRAGVTGFSQPGGSYYIGVGVRDAVSVKMIQGPRMTTAGRYITTSNGLTDFYPESVGMPEGAVGVLANNVHEMVGEVRKQVKNGVDLIKLSDSPFGDYQAFTYDEMRTISDLAHQLKRHVTIHARGPAEVDAAVRAEFDWIMHGNVMTDETIERLAESQIPLVPTLLLLANFADWGHLVATPVGVRDGCKRMLEKTAETLHKAHKAGVKFLAGTDTGFAVTPYGEWHARELELLMTYAGLSPLEAIQAMTGNAGVVLNLADQVGIIAPGKLADVLVIDGDPSKDVRILQDTRRILTVIKDGRVEEFDEEMERVRWPNERAQIYSTGDLTYDFVYGDRESAKGQERLPWRPEDARDIAAEIKARELAARLEE